MNLFPHMRLFFPAVALLGAGTLFNSTETQAQQRFFNGFETDISGWNVFGGAYDATRVGTGTNGVPSRTGGWHAQSDTAFGNWGGYNDVDGCSSSTCASGATFPSEGYYTQIGIYLDVNGGFANDTRFDFSSAVSEPDGDHQRDFVFNCGFYNDNTDSGSDGPPGTGANRFICSASTNAARENAYPKNPDKEPVVVTMTSGWFLFQHIFRNDGAGVLEVEMRILDPAGEIVSTWTQSDPADVIDVEVAGNRYAGFFLNEFPFLAFDDTVRSLGEPQPDEDNDGVADADDNCAMSDTDDPVDVNGTDTDPEVDNREIETPVPFLADSGPGCFLQDLVDQAVAEAGDPAELVDNILDLGIFLDREDEISPSENFSLRVASARADFGP